MERCYYVPLENTSDDGYEYFRPTEATVSVWADTLQHGGPPTALLVRSMMGIIADQHLRPTRVIAEILGAVGTGVNRVRAQMLRPGRQIAMVGAELDVELPGGGFRTAARASAWLMRTADTTAIAGGEPQPLQPTPDLLDPTAGITADSNFGVDWGDGGFIGSLWTAPVEGRRGETPAAWLRPAIDLVDGESITDLESLFTVIDVANGLGTRLRPSEWTWMNTDTTVHLTTAPQGPWLGVDSELVTGPHGFGATFADLYDTTGFIGRSAQTDLLAPA